METPNAPKPFNVSNKIQFSCEKRKEKGSDTKVTLKTDG